ncbi:MBL fold metallo-hydrolase [Paraconexibacter antarcticus]|uniref:MBL fold metallo-hydrolase n=1 Tax=Paraconexibacter antarcticus TaxID=2949664 RepID=A0ABY5DWT1_9ACTN|nr:MBL fold metallo-hydrolase [Paraconexibacter antarcticus]UTI66004.1 MBL fold metallo-hydrolase [Paraconexibacter antarcticus]
MSIQEIDLHHCGVEHAICAYADVEEGWIVDPGPEVSHETLLAALPEDFAATTILLTHIHFDHAGATGRLLERWPNAEVWVHERGAGHLIDPTKLVASATRIYGDDFDRLWGKVLPLPQENVRILTGTESLPGWQVQYTPGHASHHVSYLHDGTGTAFTGDVAGVRILDGPAFPPTPPPDIDLDLWRESIDLVQSWAPAALALTHFGRYTDVDAHLDAMRRQITHWGEVARTSDESAYADAVRSYIEGEVTDPVARRGYEQANPPSTLFAGMNRYWTKKAEREAAAGA